MTFENASTYCNNLILASKDDWRLPTGIELFSINNYDYQNPALNTVYFIKTLAEYWWTSEVQSGDASKVWVVNAGGGIGAHPKSETVSAGGIKKFHVRAWDINIDYGIVSYNDKTLKQNVLLVRGGSDNTDLGITEVIVPGAEYEMGDHFGFVDPAHPSDELPIHTVIVDSFYLAKTETTNEQYLAFLNSSLQKELIEVKNNVVYPVGGTDIYCYTNQFASYYSIGYNGKVFSMADFRGKHPMVGVMWPGAAAFCNWLSSENGLEECYTLKTWECDFAKNGYRLPTEAEWEYAGRGGQINPYYNYPWGNDQDIRKANWPQSGDPYEGAAESTYPHTTPVGFYDGSLHQKSEFNWPGSAATYQTSNGANAFGLFDMAGNVWELLNDWYGQNYYSIGPKNNPTGPASGFIMPDGKAYRGMRGGNWYNGYSTTAVNDGHSRVSNRNPSYYRGPQDPNHPWYHVGFRVARKFSGNSTGINIGEVINQSGILIFQNYPNPFQSTVSIRLDLDQPKQVNLAIYNSIGQEVVTILNRLLENGSHIYQWNADSYPPGIYCCKLLADNQVFINRMILIK